MPDASSVPSSSFSTAGLFSGWRLIPVCLWLIFAFIGAGNLLMRTQLPRTPANSLAVGPAFALESAATSSSAGIIPARLIIPSIGVNAGVEEVGLASNGSVETPSSFTTVAWYKDGPEPGEPGNAVIDGHVNNALTSAGVFEHLDQLELGDTVEVSNVTGKTLTYKVVSEQLYDVDSAPLTQIFAPQGPSQLVLITCDGAWDQGKKEFNERLVIYASLQS